jgi:hypothetical protein
MKTREFHTNVEMLCQQFKGSLTSPDERDRNTFFLSFFLSGSENKTTAADAKASLTKETPRRKPG